MFYPEISQNEAKSRQLITDFYNVNISRRFLDSSYTFDVFIDLLDSEYTKSTDNPEDGTSGPRVWVVDFNPW